MKQLLCIICLCALVGNVYADQLTHNYNKQTQGTFKKKKDGSIVQYDNKGKKIGVYKNFGGRFVKVK